MWCFFSSLLIYVRIGRRDSLGRLNVEMKCSTSTLILDLGYSLIDGFFDPRPMSSLTVTINEFIKNVNYL